MSLYADTYFSAPDGLRLYYRDYDRAAAGLTPVLCLPGLTRNARDFDAIAAHLSASRRVIACASSVSTAAFSSASEPS